MYVNVVRALTRREGLRLAAAGPQHLERNLATSPLVAELAPLRVLLEPVNAEIARADELRVTGEGIEPSTCGLKVRCSTS
jgi:hypothetical protein